MLERDKIRIIKFYIVRYKFGGKKMDAGALIVFVVSVIGCGLFGIYVGFHPEEKQNKEND